MSVQATNESDRPRVHALPRSGGAPRRVDALLPLGCFFLSGFVALLYEICWIRKATLVFGAASFAVSTVVAVFFARR